MYVLYLIWSLYQEQDYLHCYGVRCPSTQSLHLLTLTAGVFPQASSLRIAVQYF